MYYRRVPCMPLNGQEDNICLVGWSSYRIMDHILVMTLSRLISKRFKRASLALSDEEEDISKQCQSLSKHYDSFARNFFSNLTQEQLIYSTVPVAAAANQATLTEAYASKSSDLHHYQLTNLATAFSSSVALTPLLQLSQTLSGLVQAIG